MTPLIPDHVYFTYQFGGVNDPTTSYALPVMTNCDGLGYSVPSTVASFFYANKSTDTTGVFSI